MDEQRLQRTATITTLVVCQLLHHGQPTQDEMEKLKVVIGGAILQSIDEERADLARKQAKTKQKSAL